MTIPGFWDTCKWCFPNVRKLYSMLGTQAPVLEMTIPDLGMSVDGTFPMLEFIGNLHFSIGNDNSRLQMVLSQCWKVVQYIGNLGFSIGSDNSRSWDICRQYFSNVGKSYSTLGTQVPVLEMTIPDHIDYAFPVLESCTVCQEPMFQFWKNLIQILESLQIVLFPYWKVVRCIGNLCSSIGNNPDLGTFIDCAFPILESCKVCWEPKIQYLKWSFLILGYPQRVLFNFVKLLLLGMYL